MKTNIFNNKSTLRIGFFESVEIQTGRLEQQIRHGRKRGEERVDSMLFTIRGPTIFPHFFRSFCAISHGPGGRVPLRSSFFKSENCIFEKLQVCRVVPLSDRCRIVCCPFECRVNVLGISYDCCRSN